MASNKGNGKKDINERSTSDELEVLKIVISENQGLKTRVLAKIKQHIATSKMSLFDTANEKEKTKHTRKQRDSGGNKNHDDGDDFG